MAIFDAMFELSDEDDISIASGAGTAVASTNVINFTQSDLEMGAGEPLWLNVRMGTEALESSGSATLTVSLRRDTDSTIDTDSTVIYQTGAIGKATLVAGYPIIRMPLPYNVDEDAYIGLIYQIAGNITSLGTINAWIDHGPQSSFDTQVSASNIT